MTVIRKHSAIVGSRDCMKLGKLRRMVPWKIIPGELFVSRKDDSVVCVSVLYIDAIASSKPNHLDVSLR